MNFEIFHAKELFLQPTDPVEVEVKQRLSIWADLVFKDHQHQSRALWATPHHLSGRGVQPCSTAGDRDHPPTSAPWPTCQSTLTYFHSQFKVAYPIVPEGEDGLFSRYLSQAEKLLHCLTVLFTAKTMQNLQCHSFVFWVKQALFCSHPIKGGDTS